MPSAQSCLSRHSVTGGSRSIFPAGLWLGPRTRCIFSLPCPLGACDQGTRPLCILPSCQTYPHREPSVRPRVFCGAAAYSVRDQLKPPISDLVSKGKPSPVTSYCPSHIASCSEAGIVTSFTPGDSGWLLERSFAFAWYSGRT